MYTVYADHKPEYVKTMSDQDFTGCSNNSPADLKHLGFPGSITVFSSFSDENVKLGPIVIQS